MNPDVSLPLDSLLEYSLDSRLQCQYRPVGFRWVVVMGTVSVFITVQSAA